MAAERNRRSLPQLGDVMRGCAVVIVAMLLSGCGPAGAGHRGSSPVDASGTAAAMRPSATAPVVEPPAASPAQPTATAVPRASPSPRTPEPTSAASPSPTAPPSAPTACLQDRVQNAFVVALLGELRRSDRAALATRMAPRFQFVVEATDVGLDPVSPSIAVKELYAGVPDPEGRMWFLPLAAGAEVACVRTVSLDDLNADAGFWPGWDVGVLSTGWGAERRSQAIIVLGRASDGAPVWQGLFYSLVGFHLR